VVCDQHRGGPPLLRPQRLRGLLLGYVPRRLRRVRRAVARWGAEVRPEYCRVRHLVAAGAVAAWAGTWFEILRPDRGKLGILLGRGR
jgi:hypothetical protein